MRLGNAINHKDILTSITIFISVIGLLKSWSEERLNKKNERADKVRSAAGKVIAKLDRWQSLNLSLYENLQATFVEVSELLLKNFDVLHARDKLWKEINEYRSEIYSRILDEEINTSYVDLLAHYPGLQIEFRKLFDDLYSTEKAISGELLDLTQKSILIFQEKQNEYHSAMLGNTLRGSAEVCRKKLFESTEISVYPMRAILFQIISKPDSKILKGDRRTYDKLLLK